MEESIEMYGEMVTALQNLERCKEFASIIPEVRTNLVYARQNPQGTEDVLGIDGRITIVDGFPKAAGKVKFGASSHMARLIIEMSRKDPAMRAGINFANNPKMAKWLEKYCKNKGWLFSVIDRAGEPEEVKREEGASMPWKVAEAIRAAGGKVPKLFYEKGAIGKEPVSVLIGKSPIEVVEQVCEIARLYKKAFRTTPKIGKIDVDIFERFVLKRLGKKDKTVIIPPLPGVDASVIDIGNDKVLIIAEDPIFTIPKQSPEMFGWFTVHIGASDVAVMGVKPRYMTYTLLMPPATKEEDFKTIVDSIHKTAVELEIAIVGGHTGYYPVLAAPLIGGITVFAIAKKDKYVTPSGARPDDDIILTKGPAIETAGILASLWEDKLLEKYPSSLVEKAKALGRQMTVIKDAQIAMKVGGVTSMHDATEGGVIGGLFEIANASNVGMETQENLFIYPEEVRIVCETFNIDPVAAIAEGSLLITAKPTHSHKIIHQLKEEGIDASIMGKTTNDQEKRTMKRIDGSIVPLGIPAQDPFWPVFFKGLER
ncbi:MAG: thiamine-phosphate synthase family protein [candidate division WOR-3 bacterium]|nr:thiamine-phosphate synthase family protein [candidate division WOR-3 bacterium]